MLLTYLPCWCNCTYDGIVVQESCTAEQDLMAEFRDSRADSPAAACL